MTERRQRGDAGEAQARIYLEQRGYLFIEANWHCRAGELDLVMRDGDELVVVEVKTRHSDRAGTAEESVSAAKGRKLLATAEWYVDAHPDVADLIWRIDIVAITRGRAGEDVRITHYENAVQVG